MLENLNPEPGDIVFFVPPLLGGLLGARYATGTTVRERVLAYALSVAAGIYIGAGVGEYFHRGPWGMGGLMFFVAAVGQEALAYVIAALRQGVSDPASAARKWIDAILGRRSDG
jgi:hypothetical protein